MNTGNAATRRPAVAALTGALVALAAAGAHGETLVVDDDKIKAKAHGTYAIAGTTAAIEFNAQQKLGRNAKGSFRHTLVFQGLLVDFVGQVTCMAVDPVNGRAWIGGIVTENNSDHPSFTTSIHEPGDDIWFRVLDTNDKGEADRTTFVGFEGGGGIITSEEYCQARIWPGPPNEVPNARTNPFLSGKLKIKPLDSD